MRLSIWNSAVWLLLITGTLLGLSLPFGKLSNAAGVAPVIWAFVISFGAGGVLLAALLLGGKARRPDAARLRYFAITAAISYAFPNLLIMSAIPHLGAGFTGIMFTLSPVITLALSVLLGMRRPGTLGMAGIVVGFAGALIVSLTRGEAGRPAEPIWVIIGLAIPFSLACGNIYRTLDWPKNAGPIELAAGSHLASAAMLVVISLAMNGNVPLGELTAVPLLTLAQAAAAATMFAFFFRLQAVGGPVYLSQIGYVAAALGLVAGTVFLDERYQLATWAGAAIIMAGVAMTTKAQARQ
ncbi:MAG: DMT family transporter [Rhizobiaceae bacterium]|nr:DMT family transporter [Hyphomicrobiales bacterium]